MFYLGHYVEQNKQKTLLDAKNHCRQVRIKSPLRHKSTLSLSSSANEPLNAWLIRIST